MAELAGGEPERSKIQRLGTRRSGVEACDGLTEAAQHAGISVSRVNAHQRTPMAERLWP